jgi:Flp pilus assembly pilin Flp
LGVSSRPEEGQSTVEYGVIISLISMAVTGVLVFLGSVVSGFSTR